ncbi:MAG: SAM-dependent methyltransferase [Betaproteobacteria bacterium HGW-Betaproteobacteria-2]|nr:MAG: SAM-dependent methyltransferase [Betaproteobacteria bacterium HGW-Betaproteobacteria-2]
MKRCTNCNASFEGAKWVCPSCGFSPPMIEGIPNFAPEFSEQSDGYDPTRYETVSRFERTYFWFRGRNSLIKKQLRKYFSQADLILEIGCGTGQVLRAIREALPIARLHGTEINTSGLKYARKQMPEVEFLQIDARNIPIRDHFDVVCAFDVIEHIEEDCKVLEQMYAACKPGGGIIITVPQHPWLWSYKDEVACHKRRYTRGELQKKVSDAGFLVIKTTSFVSLLLPLMYLSRRRQHSAKSTDLEGEYRISPLLNQLFLFCSRIENGLIHAGANLQFGGSLLLLAIKENHLL